MSNAMYNSVILETLLPESLPGVALYLRANNNYSLYIGADLPFTDKDRQRLLNNNVSHLYILNSEIGNYNLYVEQNLGDILTDDKIPILKKQEILCHAAVNYVHEIFEQPAKSIKDSLHRCKSLIQYILADHFNPQQLMETLGQLVAHSSYTYVHSIQVSSYLASFFKLIPNIDDDLLLDITIGGVFHDFGKCYIPKRILDKPDKLTALEFEEIKQHTDRGHYVLDQLVILSPVALDIVRHHHEKHDGTGYPDGLDSDSISRYSKVASICDVFSALTTDRSYRKKTNKDVALDIMSNSMEGHFDQYYLTMFRNMLD
jgi:HD-GYP domain-containing protein (c-di-GMP phosphodiesterase class II)